MFARGWEQRTSLTFHASGKDCIDLFCSNTVFLNIAFAVVLIGILAGASSQPWFLVVAIVWMAVGGYFLQRSRRNRPGPPNLFDDEPR